MVSGFEDVGGVTEVAAVAIAEIPNVGFALHGCELCELRVGGGTTEVLEADFDTAVDGVDKTVGEIGVGEDVAYDDSLLEVTVGLGIANERGATDVGPSL